MKAERRSFVAGALAGALVTGVVLMAAGLVASGRPGGDRDAQAARPAESSTIEVVLENDRVRVRKVTFPPGVMNTGMHTHDLPHVGVILTQGTLVFTEAGQPPETTTFEAGSVGYRAAYVTHQVANPGKAPMRVIEVELK